MLSIAESLVIFLYLLLGHDILRRVIKISEPQKKPTTSAVVLKRHSMHIGGKHRLYHVIKTLFIIYFEQISFQNMKKS